MRANSSKSAPPYLCPYSIPTWAKTPGMVSVPIRPSVVATAPNRPCGSHSWPSCLARPPPPRRPAPASFSTPTARPMSHSPALIAMIAVRSAVAPVAQAFDTLNTGMPVWPTCFWICWPMPPDPIRLPAASTPMSAMVTPPSASAAMTASEARSTTSRSVCLPNLVMLIPRIQMSSLMGAPFRSSRPGGERVVRGRFSRLRCSFFGPSPRKCHANEGWGAVVGGSGIGGFEGEGDRLGALVVGAEGIGGEPDAHAGVHMVGVGLDVAEVAAHAGAVAVDHARHERHLHARCGERPDRERAQHTLGGDLDAPEIGAETRRARVASVEEEGAAVGALVGHQVGITVVEDQVVDDRDPRRSRCVSHAPERTEPSRPPTRPSAGTVRNDPTRSRCPATAVEPAPGGNSVEALTELAEPGGQARRPPLERRAPVHGHPGGAHGL